MGTRSDIIAQLADGTWKRIYCHWDGYLEHNGKILFDHYTSQAAIEKLVALGDLSSLGEIVGVKHAFEKPKHGTPAYEEHEGRHGRSCTAYGRDRKEKDTAGTSGESLAAVWPEEGTWTEFTYVWARDPEGGPGGKWWVGSPDEGSQTLLDLGQVLSGAIPFAPVVKAFGGVIGKHKPADPKSGSHNWTWYSGAAS